jgi:RNA polymerase sigma-32 factor
MELEKNRCVDDDIDWYMDMVDKIPKLSDAQLHELAVDYYTTGNIESAKRLTESCLKFVVWVAKKYTYNGVPLNDLIQEGNIGVMKCIKNYDPYAGVSLVTYAVYHIKSAIMNYVMKNKYLFKLGTTKIARKLFFMMYDPHPEEKIAALSKMHGVSEVDLANELDAMRRIVILRDDRDDSGDGFEDAYINTIPAVSDMTKLLIEAEEQTVMMMNLQMEITKLNARWQEVLAARYCDEPVKYADLGEKYGVSLQRVKQIERKSIQRLQEALL